MNTLFNERFIAETIILSNYVVFSFSTLLDTRLINKMYQGVKARMGREAPCDAPNQETKI